MNKKICAVFFGEGLSDCQKSLIQGVACFGWFLNTIFIGLLGGIGVVSVSQYLGDNISVGVYICLLLLPIVSVCAWLIINLFTTTNSHRVETKYPMLYLVIMLVAAGFATIFLLRTDALED